MNFSNKTKAFLGPVDVANILNSLFLLLKKEDIVANYYTFSNNKQSFGFGAGHRVKQFNNRIIVFGKNITSIINLCIKYLFFFFTLFKYNTFIFISPHTILPNNKDLKILKFFNKKVIFLFVGCVDRDVNFLDDNPEYICNRCTDKVKQSFCLCDNLKAKAYRIQYFEKYSDYIIAQDDSAGYLTKKKPIWLHLFSESPPNSNYLQKYHLSTIRIVHFPSNPEIKLSNIIVPILKKIKQNFENVEIIIKSKISHNEVLKELDTAHIVVDALGLSYGMLAIEAMARGCVVIAGDFDFINKKIPDIAVVGATSENLYIKIKELVEDRELLLQRAKKSIDFFYKYHSFEAAENYYIKKLNL